MMLRMGRLPHDPVAVSMAPKHLFGFSPPPAILDRSDIEFGPGMYQNNVYPDCSAVSLANSARAVAALNGYRLVVNPQTVPEFYASSIGIKTDPVSIAESEGAVLLNVLLYQQSRGFPIGPQTLVGRFGTLDSTSRVALAQAMNKLGSMYIGITLHDNDMQTFGKGKPWSLVKNAGPVVGGHCVIGFDYTGLGDDSTLRLGTWGVWQRCTWGWLSERIDEAYGISYRQLARADGHFYSGLSADGLMAELGSISEIA